MPPSADCQHQHRHRFDSSSSSVEALGIDQVGEQLRVVGVVNVDGDDDRQRDRERAAQRRQEVVGVGDVEADGAERLRVVCLFRRRRCWLRFVGCCVSGAPLRRGEEGEGRGAGNQTPTVSP